MVTGRDCRGVDGRWVGVVEGQGWKTGDVRRRVSDGAIGGGRAVGGCRGMLGWLRDSGVVEWLPGGWVVGMIN